ncbi:DUF4236 domain-containing protein [Mesorhizobium sp.]|uniref:DUF4236 domain-containing protein n=1 Tax=Mesorhizobium sp. TaxID=1871066 RepID=UPI000FE62D61|nr:DUF4236 domain-containing protein [Mesorhizobium sp.]RWD94515.1 MAG: DUF4236 domain-containing protein [Mesorhizobium sp.]TIV49103.1 MAG: DUF4236 domain-containing protein [Mesorhizobium sp.]
MPFRFRRTVKIVPGLKLNVGKKSLSVRAGGRGFGLTSGTAGSRVSAGLPGTGLSYTKKLRGRKHIRDYDEPPERISDVEQIIQNQNIFVRLLFRAIMFAASLAMIGFILKLFQVLSHH